MLDAMAYSASVGVTTNVDMGGFVLPGTPTLMLRYSAQFDTLASWDPFTAYDPLLALSDEGKVSVRVRIFFLSMDKNPDVPTDHPARAQCVQQFRRRHGPQFGDWGVRHELAAVRQSAPDQLSSSALTIVAQRGWAFQQHSLSL